MEFEWDFRKEALNFLKHRLRFKEALDAFYEPFAWYLPDREHSTDEVREKVIGECARGIVVVVFTERRHGVFRIISARHATRREREDYDQRRGI